MVLLGKQTRFFYVANFGLMALGCSPVYTVALFPHYSESRRFSPYRSGCVLIDIASQVIAHDIITQAYDMSKLLIYKMTPNRTSEHLTLGEYAAAGFLSAIPTTLVTAPVERAKVLLQVRLMSCYDLGPNLSQSLA